MNVSLTEDKSNLVKGTFRCSEVQVTGCYDGCHPFTSVEVHNMEVDQFLLEFILEASDNTLKGIRDCIDKVLSTRG